MSTREERNEMLYGGGDLRAWIKDPLNEERTFIEQPKPKKWLTEEGRKLAGLPPISFTMKLLGKKNRKITPMVNAMGMLKRFSPYGILASAGMLALDHGLDKSEAYRQEFEAHWLKTLGYEGVPRLEMYKGESAEAEFDRDWREYWENHPDNHSNP